MRNHEWKCRFPGCWADLPGSEFFCDSHAKYRPLTKNLFGAGVWEEYEPVSAVYVVGFRRTNAVKIGIAGDVISRIAQLQTGYPFPLKLFGAYYTKRQWAERLERACHDKLKEFGLHLHGEWFEIEPDDGVKLVEKMAKDADRAILSAGEMGSILALWDDTDRRDPASIKNVRDKIKTDWASELIDRKGGVL